MNIDSSSCYIVALFNTSIDRYVDLPCRLRYVMMYYCLGYIDNNEEGKRDGGSSLELGREAEEFRVATNNLEFRHSQSKRSSAYRRVCEKTGTCILHSRSLPLNMCTGENKILIVAAGVVCVRACRHYGRAKDEKGRCRG
jgi:hypothetical protein